MGKLQKVFFLGHGIKTTDKVKAATDLLHRDHPRVINFLKEYGPGKLGTYFVPPIFFISNPDIIDLYKYESRTQGKGKHMDLVKGQIAEQVMFKKLKKYYEESKDDVVVLHSHTFLQSKSEKDFIVVNGTKGYLMAIEIKASASSSNCQKAKKQLLEAKDISERIYGEIGLSTKFLFAGVFYATKHSPENIQMQDSPFNDSIFSIVGEETIEEKLRLIDEQATKLNRSWSLADHLDEFVNLIKNLLFIAQGNPKAPVTDSNMINKIHEHVTKASTFQNILFWIFWTPEQFAVINELYVPYVFLDAFYSTGKSSMLQYITKHWSQENGMYVQVVHLKNVGVGGMYRASKKEFSASHLFEELWNKLESFRTKMVSLFLKQIIGN